jgi:5'-nucleotidase
LWNEIWNPGLENQMLKTILLTNDDGIQSPGLKALKKELKTDYNVKVVAPYSAQSAQGVSHSHGDRWVDYEKFQDDFAVHGSPATCMSVALRELNIKPDLVVSGINFGENLGLNIFYSGTVGAAWETSMSGYLSLASSLELPPNLHYVLDESVDFSNAVYFTKKVIVDLLETNPSCKLWNLNVPNKSTLSTEIVNSSLATDRWNYPVIRERSKKNKKSSVRFEFDPTDKEFSLESDVANLRKGNAVITPIDFIKFPWTQ